MPQSLEYPYRPAPADKPVSTRAVYLVAEFPALSAPIVGSTAGNAGAFVVTGNQVANLPIGTIVNVVASGAAGNDGYYRVSGAIYNSGLNQTTVNVYGNVPGGNQGQGYLCWAYPPAQVQGVNQAGNAGSGSFAVSGDYSGLYLPGWQLDCVRSQNNSQTFTVRAAPTYNASSQQTTIPVNEAIPSATPDGYLIPHYPSPQQAPNNYPACFPLGYNPTGSNAGAPGTYAASSMPVSALASPTYVPRGSIVTAIKVGGAYQALNASLQSLVVAGGGSVTAAMPHSRIDSRTGAVLWTANRGAALLAMACAPDGIVTAGLGTSSAMQTASILSQGGAGPYHFIVSGNYTATFVPGFAFKAGSDDFTVNGEGSVLEGDQTTIYVDQVLEKDYTGDELSWNIASSGNTLEKWDWSGNNLWRVNTGAIQTAVALDSTGNIYAGDQNGNITKYDPTGAAVSGFSCTLPAPFAGVIINGLAVDPIDGRIAAAVGNLGNPSQTYGGAEASGGQYDVCLFSSNGAPITGLPWQANEQAGGFATAQQSCSFDLAGHLFTVGLGVNLFQQIIGWIFDFQGNLVGNIVWPAGTDNAPSNMGHAAAADGLGRCWVGAQAAWVIEPNDSLYETPGYTLGALTPVGQSTGGNLWLWRLPVEHICLGLAVDRGGNAYAACVSGTGAGTFGSTSLYMQVYAIDPLGEPRWRNSYWPAVSSFNFAGSSPSPGLVASC